MEPVPKAQRIGNPWGLELTGLGYQYGGIKVNRYLYNGKENQTDHNLNLYDYGARFYDPAIGRWSVADPLADLAPGWTPYRYGFNNPVKFIDPNGMFEWTDGYGTYDSNSSTVSKGAFSGSYQGTGSDLNFGSSAGNTVVATMGDGGKVVVGAGGIKGNCCPGNSGEGERNNTNGGSQDPNALDPSTLNQNIFGQHYPGGNNPRTFAGDPNYSTTPVNLAGYPAIGHDRRYDILGVAGAKGLFTDKRAIGADWRFLSEEIQVGNLSWQLGDFSTALKAYALGIGLGAAAIPKTLFHYGRNTYTGHAEVMMWYFISNQGVNNKPSK